MGVVSGSLSEGLANYHSLNQAELAVVVIDEHPHWELLETPESAYIRRTHQTHILQKAKELRCRVVTVDLPGRRRSLLERNPYIKNVVNNAEFEFIKYSIGVLGDERHKSVELLNYLEKNNVTSLLVMGGNVDCCVCDSIVGDVNYPGLSTYGFNILTTGSILSPYVKDKYSCVPCFKPDARVFTFESKFKSDNPMAGSAPLCLYDYRSNKTSEERKGEWPLFLFQPGVRFYSSI